MFNGNGVDASRCAFKFSLICSDFSIGKSCKTFAFCRIIATLNASSCLLILRNVRCCFLLIQTLSTSVLIRVCWHESCSLVRKLLVQCVEYVTMKHDKNWNLAKSQVDETRVQN